MHARAEVVTVPTLPAAPPRRKPRRTRELVERANGALATAGRRSEEAAGRLAALEDRVRESAALEELQTLKAALLRETEALARDARRVAARLDDVGETVQAAHAEIATLRHELACSRNLSLTDPLTGVANRRGLDAWVTDVLTSNDGQMGDFSLLVLDIDHFKQVNDRYGHASGDEVLAEISRRLRKSVRDEDFVSRIGGEEFCVVLPGGRREEAETVAARVLSTIRRRPVDTGRDTIHVTASAGVAEREVGATLTTTFERADRALYAAKSGGRDRACAARLPSDEGRVD